MATYSRKAGSNLTVDLNVSYGGKSLSKSITKSFSEEIVSRKDVDATDTGVQVVAFNDSSFLASSLKNSKALLVCNEGGVSAEVIMNIAGWTHGEPDANGTSGGKGLNRVLNAGEFLYLPNLSMIEFGASNNSAGLGDADALNNTVPNTLLYEVIDASGSNEAIDASETDIDVDDGGFYEEGDLIRIDDEIMEVTSISTNTLTVKRGMYGSTATTHDITGDIRLPFFNAYYDYNHALSGSSQLVQTDGQGKFKAFNFFGKGRVATANDETQGIVGGSVAIKFYNNSYAEIHFPKPITSSSSSKLTASTAYSFDLTIDDSSATNLSFTTGSNIKFGDSDGIVQKMQDSIDTATETAGGGLFGYSATVSIVKGNLRIKSNSHLAPHDGTNGSQVLIEDATSGTDLFDGATGIFPNDTNLPSPVKPFLPDDNIIDISSGRQSPNVNAFMYDDGHGNLIYNGGTVGTVSYTTGAIDFNVGLRNAQFVINAHYDSAFSGSIQVGGNHYDTGISSIYARSMNSKINTTIGIYAFN